MTWRDFPIIPTVLVLAAAATMVALGIWQLGRSEEKAELIAKYETALSIDEEVAFPANPEGAEDGAYDAEKLFRRSSFDCREVIGTTSISGKSERGQSGFAHIATCQTDFGPSEVKLGYSRDPNTPDWSGGEVSGVIAQGGRFGVRLQLDEPIEGLQPLAKPDPSDLPNNHLAYAGQWFFFALTALVIYFFALKSRVAKRD